MRAPLERFGLLPTAGSLMVSTDLHGNGEDFHALRQRFLARAAAAVDAYWLLLGDLVHGPDPASRQRDPSLYDFPDESWEIVQGVSDLQSQFPGQVLLVLGNHDYAHVGGPPTSKFWPNEAAHLESTLSPEQTERLRSLFHGALLVVAAACGVVFCHGSPGPRFLTPAQLNGIEYGKIRSGEEAALLTELMTSYGQPGAVTEALLKRLSAATRLDLRLVVHGHDREPSGYFTEGGNQAEPVIFGAPKPNKRYLELDLGKHYSGLEDLREGLEIRRVHVGPDEIAPRSAERT